MFDLSQFPELGSKRIIGIGESTHGSGGMHKLENNLVQSIVNQFGARRIAIEAPFGIVEQINARIQPGQRNSIKKDEISLLYPIWRSDELFNLILWMHAFNQDPLNRDNPIQFLGVDVRLPSFELLELLNSSNKMAIHAPFKSTQLSLDEIRKIEMSAHAGQAEAKIFLNSVATWLREISQASKDNTRIESLISRVKSWWLIYSNLAGTQDFNSGYAERDLEMFRHIKDTLLKSEGSKPIVIIAHLNHLIFNNLKVQGSMPHVVAGNVLGSYLRSHLNSDYSLIGLFAGKSNIWNGSGQSGEYTPSEDSFESLLQSQFPGTQILRSSEVSMKIGEIVTVGKFDSNDTLLNSYSKYKMKLIEQMDFVVTVPESIKGNAF